MTAKTQPANRKPAERRRDRPVDDGVRQPTTPAKHAFPARTVLVAGLGVTLTLLVLSSSLRDFLSEAAPDFLVSIGAATPRALTTLADQSITSKMNASRKDDPKAQPTSESPATGSRLSSEQIASYAKSALASDPLNSGALRILAQAAIVGDDKVEAARLMNAALQRNVHEYRAAAWLLQDSVERGDILATAKFADTLLMTNSTTRPYVVQVLAKLAEDEAGRKELVRLLAADPQWRGYVLGYLPANSPDARTLFTVLQDLKATSKPPHEGEISAYLSFLTQHQFYDFAYYVWLQFLPPDQLGSLGLINNGNFEAPLTGGPFDWTLKEGSGSTVKIEETINPSGHALYVEFGLGRVNFGGVRQTLMLGPATYRLSGRYKGEMRAERGLEWRVSCLGKPAAPLSATEMFNKSAPVWTPFELVFTVPVDGCVGQTLGLELNARWASERILSGSLWFDDLQIVATPDQATAAEATP